MTRVHLSLPYTTHWTLRKSDANPLSFSRDRHLGSHQPSPDFNANTANCKPGEETPIGILPQRRSLHPITPTSICLPAGPLRIRKPTKTWRPCQLDDVIAATANLQPQTSSHGYWHPHQYKGTESESFAYALRTARHRGNCKWRLSLGWEHFGKTDEDWNKTSTELRVEAKGGGGKPYASTFAWESK